MALLSTLKYGSHRLAHGQGLTGFALDKGERYLSAYGFGYAKGYYHDRFTFKGYGYDLWAGAGLTLLGAALQIFTGGRSKLAAHAERVGDAGIMSYLNSMGAGNGASSAGRSVAVLSAGQRSQVTATAGYPTTVMGMIPAAMGGSYLSAEEMAHFSAPR